MNCDAVSRDSTGSRPGIAPARVALCARECPSGYILMQDEA